MLRGGHLILEGMKALILHESCGMMRRKKEDPMELRKVDDTNLWKIVKLTVKENQKHFVATNTQSILQAYTTITKGEVALPFGLYEGEELVGFVMFGFDGYEDGDPEYIRGSYGLWRFMIDASHQGKGYGRKALEACLDYIRTFPCGEAKYCWLSYEPENTVARKLYESFGFVETGDVVGGEVISSLKLQ